MSTLKRLNIKPDTLLHQKVSESQKQTERCLICNNKTIKTINIDLKGSVSSDNKYINLAVSHVCCKYCGYVTIKKENRISLEKFYRNKYKFLLDSEDTEPMTQNENHQIKYSECLTNIFSEYLENNENKSFFDIGAGKGNFIDAIHRSFPKLKIYAIEPSKAYYMLKEKDFIIEHHNFFFNSKDFLGMSFDYISLIGVLEHVPNPKDFLSDIRNIMMDTTHLLVEVPNFKNNKSDLLTFDHISKFTEESITNLFNIAGFEIVKKNIMKSVPMQFVVKKSTQREIRKFDIEPFVLNSQAYLLKAINDANKIKNKDIAIYGQGLIADYFIGKGVFKIDNIICVIDDNYLYQGKKWKGLVNIVSFEEFSQKFKTKDIFLAMNDCYHNRVLNKLKNYNIFGILE